METGGGHSRGEPNEPRTGRFITPRAKLVSNLMRDCAQDPSRRFQSDGADVAGSVTGTREMSLMRFDTSLARGVIERSDRGSLGSPREYRRSLFPCRAPNSTDRASTERFTARFHPSTFVSPLQSTFALILRPSPFGAGDLPGFLPSSRHDQGASTDRETSQAPLRSVHRRSQPPDGLIRTLAPELISSPSRVQGASRSGGSLSAQRPSPRRWGLPPRRCHGRSSTVLARPASTPIVPRPRGFDPRGGACARHR
jgi:hypothetical protein